MADPDVGSSSPEEDQDFDPSAEMMVHDYDDEQTLDEEEAMSNESMGNELDDLQKESEIPVEELLAMYGYSKDLSKKTDASSSSLLLDQPPAIIESNEFQDETLKYSHDGSDVQKSAEATMNGEVDNAGITADGPFSTTDFLCSDMMDGGSDDDEDYDPDQDQEDWKKTVPIGPEHQATVSECPVGTDENVLDQDKEDRILWSPYSLNEWDVAAYLSEVHQLNQMKTQGITHALTNSSSTRDDEQALYLLLQCDNNFEEALRRHKLQGVPPTDPMSLWTEEECRNFETGLRLYGKDFFLNQQNKVKSRSVREIVQFYYLWKKSERHDSFAARTRMEKKKYALHPGITDYMDRFIYEFENPLLDVPSLSGNVNSSTNLFHQTNLINPNLEGMSSFCNNMSAASRTDDARTVTVSTSQMSCSHLLSNNNVSISLPYPSSVYDFSIASSTFHIPPTCGIASFATHHQQQSDGPHSIIQSDFASAPSQVFGTSNCGTSSFPPSTTFYLDSALGSRNTNDCSLGMVDVEGLIASSNINAAEEPQELTITDINMIFGNVDKSSEIHSSRNESIGSSEFGKYGIASSDPTFLPESMQKLCSDDGIEPTLESISATIQELVDPDVGLSPENILSVLESVPCCSVSTVCPSLSAVAMDAVEKGGSPSRTSGAHSDNRMFLPLESGSTSEPSFFHLDNLIVKEHVGTATGSGDAGRVLEETNHQLPIEAQTNLLSKTDFDPNGCPNATVTS